MNDIERKFLMAVEEADLQTLSDILDGTEEHELDINCRDPFGRDALAIAIDNQDLDTMMLLLDYHTNTGDALLYAIEQDFVDGVELLLDHTNSEQRDGDKFTQNHQKCVSGQPYCLHGNDMTPLMLAAQKNNAQMIKLLLDRNVPPIEYPHDPRCGCDACRRARNHDCLKHSRSRINAYKALSSPNLMALSSPDPLVSAFEMSAKLEALARMEPEYKEDYMRLRAQCQAFATKLLDYTRTSEELEVLLNFDDRHEQNVTSFDETLELDNNAAAPAHPIGFKSSIYRVEGGEPKESARSRLSRLKLAIQCKQKTFCAHPNIQELLATMWYENLPGFRSKNVFEQALQIVCIGLMFPIYSLAYLVAPNSQFGSYIKKPFIKFICHSASYVTFIIVLILASQRVDAFYEWSTVIGLFVSDSQSSSFDENSSSGVYSLAGSTHTNNLSLWRATINSPPTGSYSDDSEINHLAALYKHTMGQSNGASSTARGLDSLSKIFEELPASSKKRGTLPSPIESVILIWVLSLIWAELKQIRTLGLNYYKDDMWNILDSIASGCYVGTIILRIVSYVQSDEKSMELAREHWHAYDPTLLSEGLFATATIFSALKLVYIFSVNPYLGPLQISLGRMMIDILIFSWIYMLVLFAFACGMNQLLWYYADLERHQCLNVTNYNLAQYYKAKHNLAGGELGAASTSSSLLAEGATGTTSTVASIISEATTSLSGLNSTLISNATFSTSTSSPMPPPPPPPPHPDFGNMSDEKLMESALSASLEDDLSMPPVTIDDSCKTWRHFSNVFESSQTLFWANFGLVDLENFDLTGIRQYTRFWALLMFGCYCFINVIVVLNLLIAMMNHSYVKISKRSDIEWKFARTRLWVSYFENGSTVPAPFNMIPSIKSILHCGNSLCSRLCDRPVVKDAELVELSKRSVAEYYVVMKSLVGRYLVGELRKSDRHLTHAKLMRWSRNK